MRTMLLACAAACLAIVCPRGAARAQAPLEEPTGAPYFVVPGVDPRLDPLPLREVAVHADISGVVADVTVTQLWENTGAAPVDATYVFPLSTRAAVHALEMRVGGRRIIATIKEKEAARQVYEEARKHGQTATLLEQSRPNMFTTQVANIQPGDIIEVELSYVELLRPTDGVYSLVVPKVVGPRYVSPAEAFPDIPWSAIAWHDDHPAPVLHAWPVTVSLRGGVPVQWAHSSTHPIVTEHDEDGLDIELSEADPDATQDFVLDYALGGDALETGVLVQHDADGQGGHFLALIEPPERVDPALVPRRDYVFIVDTSGSMSGWPLEVATKLVGALVDGLDRDDRVNVMCFSGGSERLAPRSVPATASNKARAKAFLGRQQGSGGTELLQALETAFATPPEPGLARTFVLVTDGFVTVEAQAIDLIRARAGAANVFAMGVGSGVNRFLLEAVAHAGRGEPYIALDERSAFELADRFFEDVRAPVLTDIALRFEGFDAYDLEPRAIPTLYAARPILVSGRYRGAAAGALVVTGATGEGPWGSRTPIVAAELNPAVPLLWARERIARLSDFAGAYDAPDHKAAITALGLAYALVTQHTSFVAVDDGRVTAANPPSDGSVTDGKSGGEGLVMGHGSGGMGFTGGGIGGGGGVGDVGRVGQVGRAGQISGMGLASSDIDTGGLGLADKGEKVAPRVRLSLSVRMLPTLRAAPSDVLRLIKRRLGALRACIEQAPAPKRLVWTLAIGGDGRVAAVKSFGQTLEASAMTCLERQLRQIRFAMVVKPLALRVELLVTL